MKLNLKALKLDIDTRRGKISKNRGVIFAFEFLFISKSECSCLLNVKTYLPKGDCLQKKNSTIGHNVSHPKANYLSVRWRGSGSVQMMYCSLFGGGWVDADINPTEDFATGESHSQLKVRTVCFFKA